MTMDKDKPLSDCCGCPPADSTDICPECKEHCQFLTEAEFNAKYNKEPEHVTT